MGKERDAQISNGTPCRKRYGTPRDPPGRDFCFHLYRKRENASDTQYEACPEPRQQAL